MHRAQYAEIEAPCLNIELHGAPTQGSNTSADCVSGRPSIGFRVEDLDAALRCFDGRGVVYRLEEDEAGRRAHFEDPDGRPLYLIERG